MKFYITNHSNKKLSSERSESIYIHYFSDCIKLNADYEEGDEQIPNSGIQEKDFDGKEKFFSLLLSLGKFIICKECEQREMVTSYDQHILEEANEMKLMKEAVLAYDEFIKSGKSFTK